MSVICCRIQPDAIHIAADSIGIRGRTQNKDDNKHSKLAMVNGMIIGGVGTAQENSLLQLYCSTRRPASSREVDILIFISEFATWKKEKISVYEIKNTYFLLVEGKAFTIEHFFIEEILTYNSIGAGMDFALAALYMGHGVEDAVKTACHLSIACEAPIKMFSMPRNGHNAGFDDTVREIVLEGGLP